MKIVGFTLSLLLLSQVVTAQPICQSLYLDAMTEGKASVLKPELNYTGYKLVSSSVIKPGITKKSPDFKKALAELIQMHSDTLYISAGEKVSLEKGELFLAKRLDQDSTLELSYQGDLRSAIPSFRLVKAAIVKGNAQNVVLTKEPLIDNGTELKLKSFVVQRTADGAKSALVTAENLSAIDPVKNSDDPLSAINNLIQNSSPTDRVLLKKIDQNSKEIEVPVVIEGDLLKRFVLFADDLGLMDRSKVRDYIGNDKLNSLWALSKVYASYDFTKQVAKKQIYKYMLVGAAFYGVAMVLRDDVSNVVEKKIDEIAIQSKMTHDDLLEFLALFSDIYQPWSDEAPALSERMWDSVSIMGPMEKMENFKKFREDLGRALIKEYKNKSTVEYYFTTGRSGNITKTTEKVISDLEGAELDNQELLFIHLPYSKKIFVGVLGHSGKKKSKVESIAYTVVTKKEASNLYEHLISSDFLKKTNPIQPKQLLTK